jgi:hypothetical protein
VPDVTTEADLWLVFDLERELQSRACRNDRPRMITTQSEKLPSASEKAAAEWPPEWGRSRQGWVRSRSAVGEVADGEPSQAGG